MLQRNAYLMAPIYRMYRIERFGWTTRQEANYMLLLMLASMGVPLLQQPCSP